MLHKAFHPLHAGSVCLLYLPPLPLFSRAYPLGRYTALETFGRANEKETRRSKIYGVRGTIFKTFLQWNLDLCFLFPPRKVSRASLVLLFALVILTNVVSILKHVSWCLHPICHRGNTAGLETQRVDFCFSWSPSVDFLCRDNDRCRVILESFRARRKGQ